MTEPLLFPVEHDTRGTTPRWTLHQLVNGDVERALAAAAEPGPTEPVDIVPDRRCRYCGCTDDRACDGGCWWIADDVCSSCGSAARADGVDVGGIRRQLRPAIARRLPAHAGPAAPATVPCDTCHGTGHTDAEDPFVQLALADPTPCPDCAGSGVVTA